MINFVTTLKWVLLVTTLTSRVNADDTHGIEKRDTNGQPKKIVCYYTNWSVYRPGTAKFTPQNINPYLCTHLIYAFGGLDKENGLQPFDKYQDLELGGYAKFNGLKTYNKNLKTMLAIGGWNEGSARFSKLVADEDRRAAFVKNVVRFLRQYNFDGLDLDWEYPAFRDGSQPEDRENYASLVKELREEFEKESSKTGRSRLLLTMAVPAGIEYIDKGYDVPKLNRYLDFLNILSYDYHSAYEPNANHHAPLYSQQEESEYNFDAQLTIDHTIKHYLKKGADPEKLVLGIPTYGRSYTLFNPESTDIGSPADGPGQQGEATREKGYLAYYEICGNVGNDDWKVIQPKKGSLGPYAFHGNQWVGYDDVDIVKEKAKFVNEKGLGGIMYWSIDNDDFRGKCHGKPYPLIEAGKEALLSSNSGSSNIVPSSTEEKRTKLGLRKNRPKQINTTQKPASTTTKSMTSTAFNPLSTPEPPTTPDPGSDFVCKDEGFFPHPRDCKKYFWCLDSGPSNLGIVAHQFTCPSGLLFNKISDSCDYSRNVICNKKSDKSSTTTTTTAKTSTASAIKIGSTTTSTTTTTTTEAIPEEEYVDAQEDSDSQEDPKAIKQLISLIKKLGGISELEKQLKLEDNSHEVTTPAISKNLYNKVFIGPTNNRFKNQYRNGPSGPQNEGLPPSADVPYRKDKPQYVTIQRSRPLKNIPQDTENSGTSNNKSIEPSRDDDAVDYADNSELEERSSTPRYSLSSPRSRSTTTENKSTSLRYVVLERTRPDRTTTEEEELIQETPSSSTHRYITLLRHRQSTTTKEPEDQSASTTEAIIRSTSRPSSRSDKEESTYSDRSREKPSTRLRGNFRRNNPSLYTRTRSTTSTSTTAAPVSEYSFNESNKLASRFRRRKIRPENRSINTARSENYIPLSEIESSTVTRHKNNDGAPTHGPSHVSDYLPVPAPLYRFNQSIDQLQANNVNSDEVDLQTSPAPISYQNDDISDLAHPAVAAISNLKTLPPASSPQPFVIKTEPPFTQQIIFNKEVPAASVDEVRIIKSTPRAITAPVFQQRISRPRGSSKIFAKVTSTTQQPSLQDIYNDYQDPELEYHADPVDIPISGKVRIHSDGYIECLDMGNFPHPFSCKKFISCAKMEYESLLGWEYTCPKGLSFDPIGGICNWAAGLGCKE